MGARRMTEMVCDSCGETVLCEGTSRVARQHVRMEENWTVYVKPTPELYGEIDGKVDLCQLCGGR